MRFDVFAIASRGCYFWSGDIVEMTVTAELALAQTQSWPSSEAAEGKHGSR
jgi:hypothetical protein